MLAGGGFGGFRDGSIQLTVQSLAITSVARNVTSRNKNCFGGLPGMTQRIHIYDIYIYIYEIYDIYI